MLKKLFITLAVVSSISACSNKKLTGNFVKDELLSSIKVGTTTKRQVHDLFGSPTLEPETSPNMWYYVAITTSQSPVKNPKIIDQKIVKIAFNSHDIVEKVDVSTELEPQSIKINNAKTKVVGPEESSLKQFVKNIGRFNKPKK